MTTYNLRNCGEERALKKAFFKYLGWGFANVWDYEGDTYIAFMEHQPNVHFQEVENKEADLIINFKCGSLVLKEVIL